MLGFDKYYHLHISCEEWSKKSEDASLVASGYQCFLVQSKLWSSGGSGIFLRGPTQKVGALTYYFAIIFAQNCMKNDRI